MKTMRGRGLVAVKARFAGWGPRRWVAVLSLVGVAVWVTLLVPDVAGAGTGARALVVRHETQTHLPIEHRRLQLLRGAAAARLIARSRPVRPFRPSHPAAFARAKRAA